MKHNFIDVVGEMQKLTTFASGVVLAAGLAALGYFIGDGLHSLKPNTRSVSVRGLSEREVMADSARLVVRFENTGAAPTEIFPVLAETQKQTIAYLKQFGIKDEEIAIGQWGTARTSAEEIKNDPSLPLYEVSGSIVVTTANVAAVGEAYRKLNELRVATADAVKGAKATYSFAGLAPIRAEMIAAATKDARNAALQFATDSGSRVGSINGASQGVFQILPAGNESDEGSAIRKIVRVVTTVNYELRD